MAPEAGGSEELLPCVEVDPIGEARCTVLWLHGLGADGHDFEPLVPYLDMPPEWGVRFVFPHAPSIPVTINGGFVMPAWYDILEMDLRRRIDEEGARRSAAQVEALIEREIANGIPAERIVLAGFSQGGAIALHLGLRYPRKLAGIMALSTYLVCADSVADERSDANLETPVFQAHGEHDPMVAVERGAEACAKLQELGYSVSWNSYPMQHEVSPHEIRDIGVWLRKQLASAAPAGSEPGPGPPVL